MLACYLLVAALHLVCGVSIDHCSFVLGSLRLIVTMALQTAQRSNVASTSGDIPGDVRTVVDILDVTPKGEAYVCCPKCFFLYWVDPDNPKSCYPETCTNQEVDNNPCSAKLRKKRRHGASYVNQPVREFCYQSMQDWVGRLYARRDLLDYLDRNPCSIDSDDGDTDTWDIWDAPGLREFLGPDQTRPFVPGPGREGRLVFSLNMDGFNPYGNKEAGKKVSTGGIYMICLNLPPSIRYDVENMYLVGIIPGPQEPSRHEINYLLRPLVDDLLLFWKRGIYYTKTCRYPRGLLVRCAVVPLVCDLPAARQMSGFAHFKSKHFCSLCHQKRDDINNLDYKQWKARTSDEHRQAARGWRDASTQAAREQWYTVYGVRWSELLRLPYWDPTSFTVIDSMHAFYLRLFQHHCRSIWGMDINFQDGDGITFDHHPNAPTEAEMIEAHSILERGTQVELQQLKCTVVQGCTSGLERQEGSID